MPSSFRLLAFVMGAAFVAAASARYTAEKGTRGHRNRLSAGQQHTCAVLDDGTVECWGRNTFGQLGDGTVTTRLAPVPVTGLGTVVSIASGSFHTCAILSSGVVRCWGFNDHGQLGNGTTGNSSVPVAVTGLTNVVAIASGFLHTCAVKVDGSTWCWGAAIANGNNTDSSVPVKVSLSGAVTVTAGANHSCALLADSTVRCWGQNDAGQAGYFSGMVAHSAPARVTDGAGAPITGVLDIAAGSRFTCAQTLFGSLVCWGDNELGQYGDGTTYAGQPYAFESGVSHNAVAFATGSAHTCVILVDGSVECFGRDEAGQLGFTETFGNNLSPHSPGVTDVIEITAGDKHTCALIVDGSIRCWGDNTYGQHGDGISGQTGMDTVSGISGSFLGRGVVAGNQFPCGRRGAGTPACWGAGTQGQLGDSASASSSNPLAVTGIANAIALSTGSAAHACSIDSAGVAKCWGANSRGQLGNGTTISSNQPVPVSGGKLFTTISTGDLHTCAIDAAALLYCWGAGDRGQLGTGSPTDATAPGSRVAVLGVVAVATGNQFACALTPDGRVSCWGDNSLGQVGIGGNTQVNVPSDVGLANIVGIAAGANHACAVSVFGSVLCWGSNSRGQIGNNSTNPATFPTTVQGITDAVSVSAGAFFTCAVQAGGTASCWGANDSGELAAIDSVDHLTPTAVGSFRLCGFCSGGRVFAPLSGVVAIAAGTSTAQPTRQHACALLATGVIDCWGNNAQGEVGDGTNVNQSRPTVVNSFAANVDPAGTLENEHVARVTALINCDAGDDAHIILTVTQGAVSTVKHSSATCEGRLQRVPIVLPAEGPQSFHAGAATAQVEAIVRKDGIVVEDTHWTKQVVLSAGH